MQSVLLVLLLDFITTKSLDKDYISNLILLLTKELFKKYTVLVKSCFSAKLEAQAEQQCLRSDANKPR